MVDHGDDKQRQTHLARAKYAGIHGAYVRSTSHKFAAANARSWCKKRIDFAQPETG
jgi:hypothetical protein